jgi:UPF0755 protein
MKRLVFIATVVAMAGAAGFWWIETRLTTPYRGFTEAEVFVELAPGASVARIAADLVAAGVVADPLTFRLAARISGNDRRLQAGEYRFVAPASPFDIVDRLARGDVYAHPLTFPEGLTIKEMGVIFERARLGTAADFERAGADGSLVGELDPDAKTLEGYLFPDTYALPRKAGAEGAVAAMVDRFQSAFGMELRAEAAARKLSLREVVTLASLIEEETAAPSERPLVSAVYHNRLKLRMPLQCDPTVIYALMQSRRWRGNLTRQDLQVNSPYNTYRFAGLPPGPIASPGLSSLRAAVRPADVPYLYFVSRNDGTHVFATTLAEHNRNVQQWQVRYFQGR